MLFRLLIFSSKSSFSKILFQEYHLSVQVQTVLQWLSADDTYRQRLVIGVVFGKMNSNCLKPSVSSGEGEEINVTNTGLSALNEKHYSFKVN